MATSDVLYSQETLNFSIIFSHEKFSGSVEFLRVSKGTLKAEFFPVYMLTYIYQGAEDLISSSSVG